jgi:hypothetical protein
MAFNFPSTPTDGQIYTDATSGAQYIYKSAIGAWMQSSAAQIKLSAETRNRIVNPAMQISQENGSSVVVANGAFIADQWVLVTGGISINGALRLATVTPDGSPSVLNTSLATVKGALAAGDLWGFGTVIEGNRLADFQWGTAAAKQAVLRFSFLTPVAGTYTVAIRNAATTRSWIGTFTAAANTWTKPTFVIPGDVSGTWAKDNTIGLYLNITFASGATLTAPATGWNAGNFVAAPGMTNGAGTAAASFNISDVGLYLDPQATGAAPPWQMPDEAQELAACQRYYLKSANQIVDTGTAMQSFTLPVPMRVLPTITGGGAGFVVYSGDPMGAGTMAIYQTTRNTIPITYSARM